MSLRRLAAGGWVGADVGQPSPADERCPLPPPAAGLALQSSLPALLALALAALAARSPKRYAAWREPLGISACAASMATTQRLVLLQRSNLVAHHGGSPLLLLLLLALNNWSVWLCIHVLFGRLLWRWSAAAVPALALGGLVAGEGLCAVALQAPGVAAPLAQLHAWLRLVQ